MRLHKWFNKTNLRHLVIGGGIGIIMAAIYHVTFSHMPVTFLFFTSILFFIGTILFELLQFIASSKSFYEYFTMEKTIDTIMDIIFGNIGYNFMLYLCCLTAL